VQVSSKLDEYEGEQGRDGGGPPSHEFDLTGYRRVT
jgi:hypothetical protein